MIQSRPDGAFQRGVDLGQQSADAVADLGDLGGEVVVESAEHRELGNLFIRRLDRAKRVRHCPCGLRDDRRIPRVGLGLARVQICDASHRKSR